MNDLINEYRGALKEVEQYKVNLLKVRNAKKPLPPPAGQKRIRNVYNEDATLTIVNGMIDSLKYTIDWLELGHEPNPRRAIYRRSVEQRKFSVADVETVRQWFLNEHGNAFVFEDNEAKISEWDQIRIEDAMCRMSEREKEVFILHHARLKSYSQIADELEISIRSVREYLKRGREKIQNQIDESLFCMQIC